MPRRKQTDELEDTPMPGLEDLEQDKPPARTRTRSRATSKPSRPRQPRSAGTGRIMTKAQMKAQVATELYAFATMGLGIWGMKDPECAGVFYEDAGPVGGGQERLEAIINKTVDILARNDKLLGVFANAGMIGECLALGSLLWPVVAQVWTAHGPNGHSHQDPERIAEDYANQYPPPVLAAR